MRRRVAPLLFSMLTMLTPGALAQEPPADERARVTEQRMTDDERFSLVYGLVPTATTVEGSKRDPRAPKRVPQAAGWVKGVPRLGIPDLLLTDGSLGIAPPPGGRPGDTATALPSGQMLAATFNPALARESGAIIGREARARGLNVVLGGGMNLARDVRNGRNFEYFSEDPLLSAIMAAETVKGTQGEGVIGMLKHVSLNSLESDKWFLDAQIDPAAHREAELLAFQIAIERADPGALMCAPNKVNGVHACSNDALLNGVIRNTFGFKGWIMSDWKAVYGWEGALKGLDQHAGGRVDEREWFVGGLREAYAKGAFPKERLSEMVRRILRSIYVVGIDKWGAPPKVDLAAHRATALEVARQGIVLLKNDAVLPLAADVKQVAVIGGFAHVGAMGGGGSSQVDPIGGFAATMPLGGEGPLGAMRRQVFIAPGPIAELRKLMPKTQFIYNSGEYPAEAEALARRADVVLVFATRLESEGFDVPDMSLPWGQDTIVQTVAFANANTIVVLQTGNAISMPWRDRVKAIVAAWYPGQAGSQAIAEVLAGTINPSGRLPVSFVASADQTPHPKLVGFGEPMNTPVTIRYHEGAEVGYRWLARTGTRPTYAFGHGLSYTTFGYSDLRVQGGETVTASFVVTNTGKRAGADVPQLYLVDAPGDKRMRLLGFERVDLQPGESRRVTLTADPRLLARFDAGTGQWRIYDGVHRFALGRSASDLVLNADAGLTGRRFGK